MAKNKEKPNDFADYNGAVVMDNSFVQETTTIIENARTLANNFRNNVLHKDYCRYKKAVEEDPLLLKRVVDYKKIQLELESKRLADGSVGFDEEKRVAHQFSELSLHPVAGPFLAYEYELLNLYRQVFKIIDESCDVILTDDA